MSHRVVSSTTSGCLSLGLTSSSSFASSSSADGQECSNGDISQDPNRITNSFDKVLDFRAQLRAFDSDSEVDFPLKSVAAPNIKTYDTSPVSRSPSTPFCGAPAPTSSLEASKALSKDEKTPKTTKSLRFDFSPSFFGDNVPDEACVREIQQQNSADSGGYLSQRIHPYLAPLYPVSVKNTFVHLDRSLAEDNDCDDLPLERRQRRCVSAPAMPTLSDQSIGVIGDTDSLASDTPLSSPREYLEPNFPIELLEGDACSIVQRPLHLPVGSCLRETPGIASQTSVSSFSSSVLDGSRSFRVKNTFVHVDVNKDDEQDDGFHLPRRRVSEPVFKFVQDASPTNAPAATTLPSRGAALHRSGQCKPCAWFWKPESCQWGAECQHCHLCPMGELRHRKKERQAEAKQLKRAAALAEEMKREAAALADEAATLADNCEGFQ